MRAAFMLKDRSDQELLHGIVAAVAREFEDVSLVVAHIAEMEKRKLFAGEGCSSLSTYCMEVLNLTKDQAYSRIAVAKVALKFPVVLEMLADGLVHLTAVDRLGPSLTEENHLSILEEATLKSMAQVEEMVARLRPKPPIPSSIYKLGRKSEHGDEENLFEADPAVGSDGEVQEEQVPPARACKSSICPLGPGSHDVHITADDEMMYALRELQELLSHQVPNGDPAIIFKFSLLKTLKVVKKERFGTGKRWKKAREKAAATEGSKGVSDVEAQEAPTETAKEGSKEAPGEDPKGVSKDGWQSRYIPKEIRKAVWERDGGRCAFRSTRGKWCTARRFLEYHHIIPFAWRGETTVDNLELRCRTHNAYEGDLIFGKVISRSDPRGYQVMARTGFKTSTTGTGTCAEVPTGGTASHTHR